MNEILLLGAGPVPTACSIMTCSYNLRTAKIARWLRREGFAFQLAAIDIFGTTDAACSVQASLAGEYTLFAKTEAGQRALADFIRETQPRAIVAISYEAAAAVCAIEHAIPLWADMPGWIMTEAQLKAATAGSDAYVEHFAERERRVLERADVISVVSHNQRHATLGELAMLGRLSRRNIAHDLVRVLPSLALDWQAVLEETGEASSAEGGTDLPPDAPVLLWSGTYNLWTDSGRIDRLVGDLMHALPSLHFVSTGGHIPHHNDELYHDFLARTAASGHAGRIHMLPWLPFNVALAWLKRASLGLCIDGVNLEVAYGSRTRVVEMLAQGLPVATTTGTELVNDLAQAGAVIALDPADPQGWAQAIEPYFCSPEKLAQLAAHGRRYVHEHYALERVGRELREWLRAPRRAPDLAFRDQIKLRANGSAVEAHGAAGISVMSEAPLVTWQPQRDIEAFARRVLDPYPPGRASRLAQRAGQILLGRAPTRWPALAAWWLASRALPPLSAARWQSRVDQWLGAKPQSAAAPRLIHGVGRAVYGRALRCPIAHEPLKAVNILLARHEYDRERPLLCFPQRIEIEATSVCNLRCLMCKIPTIEKPAVNMPRALFGRIAPYLKYVTTLELIGEGEPTLHPELPAFLEAARASACHVRMFTNGTRLTPELCAALVRSRMDSVVVSLCAGERRTYAQVTGADMFDRVIENVRDLQEVKRLLGSPFPRLHVNCPVIADTLQTMPGLVRQAAALGISTISFGVAMIFREELEAQSLSKLPPAQVREVFAECEALGRQAGMLVLTPRLKDAEHAAPAVHDELNRFGCLYPWQSLRIRADGIVETCTYNRKIIGDLNEASLPEIWNGAEQQRFRANQVRHHGVNYCDACYHRSYRAGSLTNEQLFPYHQCWHGYR